MHYGFIADESLQRLRTHLTDIGEMDQGSGYFDDAMANYFIDRVSINDTRTFRLSILSQRALGRIAVQLDKNRFSHDALFDGVPEEDWQKFQNIVEKACLSSEHTTNELNNTFISDIATYGIYVAESLTISAVTTPIPVTLEDMSTVDVAIPTWIKFGVMLEGLREDFYLWLSRESFFLSYPHCTVTAVVPPAKPIDLVDLDYSTVVEAIKETADFMAPVLNSNIGSNDHSGYAQFQTRYVNSKLASHHYLTFGIFYKGSSPSSQTCRLAIKEYLEATPEVDKWVWQGLFPDLFTVAQFYLIPMWDNTAIVGASTIFPGIVDGSRMPLAAKDTLPLPDAFIDEHYAVVRTAVSELFLVAVPDSLNEEDNLSLRDIHVTYQAVGSENINYAKQTTETQDFNEKLCGCLTNLLGATNNATYIQNEINGRYWLSFTSNHIEYHVLYRDHFPII